MGDLEATKIDKSSHILLVNIPSPTGNLALDLVCTAADLLPSCRTNHLSAFPTSF